MNFDEIVLTKTEMKMLKFLSESDAVLLTEDTRDLLCRLEHFGLAEIFVVSRSAYKEAVKKTGDWIPKAAKITDKGLDYLSYQKAKSTESHANFLRDVVMLILGSAIALFFEHLPGIAAILHSLFQHGGK